MSKNFGELITSNSMCWTGYVFGGDLDILENPQRQQPKGYNKYKLCSRSKLFEGIYCIMLLYAVSVGIIDDIYRYSIYNICSYIYMV